MLKHGVPFNAAFGRAEDEPVFLLRVERQAMAIMFSEFEGGRFDWEALRWEERE